jgi:hypothetical protein
MTSEDGLYSSEVLPGDFVDAVVFMRDPIEGEIWISQIEISSGFIAGEIASAEGVFATFEAELVPGITSSAEIVSTGASTTSLGLLVFGSHEARFSRMANGKTNFPEGALVIQSGLIARGTSVGVRAITIGDSRISGLVRIKEGPGIRLETSYSGGYSILTIHADGQFSSKECTEGPILQSINSIAPNPSGGLSIMGAAATIPTDDYDPRQVIRVTGLPNGIRVSLIDPNL